MSEINLLVLIKPDGDKYVFLYSDENATETLRQAGRYAANPDIGFSWYDAAVVSQKVRGFTKTIGE